LGRPPHLEEESTIGPSTVLLMNPAALAGQLFTPAMLDELRTFVTLDETVVTELDQPGRRALQDAEIVIGGWGAPRLSPADAPRLRSIVYLGGVAALCLENVADWSDRGLTAANARSINAEPVAEYALAMILLDGKDAFASAAAQRADAAPAPIAPAHFGNFRRTVGIVGLSQTARALIELLRPFDLDIIVYSPELTPAMADELGVGMRTLEEVMAESDIVSLHQPLTPATRGQIDRRLLSLMRDGATLLNTARGGVVDQEALVELLRTGRIRAVLDVTEPEPLAADHELRSLPNVVLTPHIAGSLGSELHRMGQNALDEVHRFVDGLPFRHPELLA